MEWLSPPSLTPASRQTCPACSGREHSCCIAEDCRYTARGALVGEGGDCRYTARGALVREGGDCRYTTRGALVGEGGDCRYTARGALVGEGGEGIPPGEH